MERLATWTRPVVMIPGNHDQVTLGGGVHSLTPLQFAFADPKQARRTKRKTLNHCKKITVFGRAVMR